MPIVLLGGVTLLRMLTDIFPEIDIPVSAVREGVVHFVPVHVETDQGTETLLSAGLRGDEQVVVTPSERLVEGLAVTVAPALAESRP